MVLFSYYKVSFFIVNEKKNLHSAADNKRHEVILSNSWMLVSCLLVWALHQRISHPFLMTFSIFLYFIRMVVSVTQDGVLKLSMKTFG